MTEANRFEPTFGVTASGNTFLSGLGIGVKKTKTHEAILGDALQAFTDAQAKLDEAHSAIFAQVNEHRDQATFHQNKAVEAGESLTRLERVKAKFADLLA